MGKKQILETILGQLEYMEQDHKNVFLYRKKTLNNILETLNRFFFYFAILFVAVLNLKPFKERYEVIFVIVCVLFLLSFLGICLQIYRLERFNKDDSLSKLTPLDAIKQYIEANKNE